MSLSFKIILAVFVFCLNNSAISGRVVFDDNVKISIKRLAINPIITPSSSLSLGKNINGPSVIEVPDWIEKPLGKFYMYFAHHKGKFIRLAYSDDPAGPWEIYEPGTLEIEDAALFDRHIASPDVIIDSENQVLRMYFHGPAKSPGPRGQWTGVALSSDGINFKPQGDYLGKPYFRVWKFKDFWYAIAKDGNSGWGKLYQSSTGLDSFEGKGEFIQRVRHVAVHQINDTLLVFYSRVGDAPESIVASTLDMSKPWMEWETSNPIEVLSPETDYEGVNYKIKPSRNGSATEVNQLRDPYVFAHAGKFYLYYTVAGESGIAVAELNIIYSK